MCLFVCHRVKRTLPGRTLIVISFDGLRGTSMRGLESEVRFPRTTMVARQPIHRDFTEMGLSGRFETWEIRIRGPFPSKLIGWSGTNENRVSRKHVILGYFDAGNTNPAPKYLKNPLVDREPMEIELAGNTLFWGISMRETRIRRPNTLKAKGPPKTNGVRASWEISPYSRLKQQLKSCIHSS